MKVGHCVIDRISTGSLLAASVLSHTLVGDLNNAACSVQFFISKHASGVECVSDVRLLRHIRKGKIIALRSSQSSGGRQGITKQSDRCSKGIHLL